MLELNYSIFGTYTNPREYGAVRLNQYCVRPTLHYKPIQIVYLKSTTQIHEWFDCIIPYIQELGKCWLIQFTTQ